MSKDKKSKKSKKESTPKSPKPDSKTSEKYEVQPSKKGKSSKAKSSKSKSKKHKNADEDEISVDSKPSSEDGLPSPNDKVIIAVTAGVNVIILVIAIAFFVLGATTSCQTENGHHPPQGIPNPGSGSSGSETGGNFIPENGHHPAPGVPNPGSQSSGSETGGSFIPENGHHPAPGVPNPGSQSSGSETGGNFVPESGHHPAPGVPNPGSDSGSITHSGGGSTHEGGSESENGNSGPPVSEGGFPGNEGTDSQAGEVDSENVDSGSSSETSKPPAPTASENVLFELDAISNPNIECGVPAIEPDLQRGRIVGGAEAIPHSWPYALGFGMVQLMGGSMSIKQMCGATLISPRHALTAAHCFRYDPEVTQPYTVFASLHNSETYKGFLPIRVAGVRMHPKGNTLDKNSVWLEYDFAVLTLNKEVVPNDNIKFACLPPLRTIPPAGELCWAVGWGKTQDTGAENLLKQVRIDIVSEERCKQEYYSGIFLTSTICGGTIPGQDTCQGDSGGPLFCKENGKWVLHGVTSYGPSVCGEGPMAAYGTVSYNLEWICCFMPTIPGCSGISCISDGNY